MLPPFIFVEDASKNNSPNILLFKRYFYSTFSTTLQNEIQYRNTEFRLEINIEIFKLRKFLFIFKINIGTFV